MRQLSKNAAKRREAQDRAEERSRRKGFFPTIREKLFGERQQGIVAPLGTTTGWGKSISPKFSTMIDYYKSDPFVKDAIDEIADSIVGAGFYLEAGDHKDHTIKEATKNALSYAEDWVEEIDLDGILQVNVRELVATGNWIAEAEQDPINMDEIIPLPISSIKRVKTATIYGNIVSLQQKRAGKWKTLRYDKLIHWAWNRMDASLWGCGILEPLLNDGVGYKWKDSGGTTHTDHRPSWQSMNEEIQDSMRKVIRRYVPRTIYGLLGFTDPAVRRHANTIASTRPEDDLVIGAPSIKTQKIEIHRVGTDPRSRLDPFIDHFHNATVTGTQSATQKIARGKVTEASANTLLQIQKWRIAGLRRFIKRKIEETIIKPRVMKLMGWRADYKETLWKKAHIRLRWGVIEEPDIEVADLIRLSAISAKYGIPYITPDEVRQVLRKRGIEMEQNPVWKWTKEQPEEKEEKEDETEKNENNGKNGETTTV